MEKVVLIKCEEYDYQRVYDSLKRAFDLKGGLGKHIREGNNVLLKLNLVMKKNPELAATTHPVVVEAMVNLIKELGAKPIIADSPGGLFTEGALRGVYKMCGIEDVANRTGAVLNYNVGSFQGEHREGARLKSITLASYIEEVDVIISMAKLKTHGMTLFTGAVKNMFGTIPGLLKAQYHYEHSDAMDFCRALVDICSYVKPHLSVMDGIIGMEGEGPTSGKPRKAGVLMVSESPYALDTAAASLIGIEPLEVKTILAAREKGIFSGDIKDMEILGESLDSLKQKFEVPPMKGVDFKGNLPDFVYKFVNKALRPKPVFIHNKCLGCRDCERVCPAKVIKMVKNKPVVSLKDCIRCFCCQELCPHKAVEIKRSSWITKISAWTSKM